MCHVRAKAPSNDDIPASTVGLLERFADARRNRRENLACCGWILDRIRGLSARQHPAVGPHRYTLYLQLCVIYEKEEGEIFCERFEREQTNGLRSICCKVVPPKYMLMHVVGIRWKPTINCCFGLDVCYTTGPASLTCPNKENDNTPPIDEQLAAFPQREGGGGG